MNNSNITSTSKHLEFDSIEKYVWDGFNCIGRTISQIQNDERKGRIVSGDQANIKTINEPIWHSKPELDKLVARSMNLNMNDYYKGKEKKRSENSFYKAVANEVGRLRKAGILIDWKRIKNRKTGMGVWRLDKQKLETHAFVQARLEIKQKKYHYVESKMITYQRAKQNAFRSTLFEEYCNCVLCGFKIPEYMIDAHIVPYSVMREKEPENAMNPTDGLLLCRFCDVAFDKGTIMIEEDLGIIISEQLKERREEIVKAWLTPIPSELNIQKDAKYPPDAKYLKWKKELVLKNKQGKK